MTEVAWENLDGEYAGRPAALTVGVFDGLHTGHRELISRVVDTGWLSVVVTFQRHPTEVLLHDTIPGFIMSLGQKRRALREMGVDLSVLVDFDERFRLMPGVEFLRALAESFDLRRLVVGHDFRCGYRLDTDVDAIQAFFHATKTDVVEVGPVARGEGTVSSTRIRSLILEGELQEAAALLGRPYALDVVDEQVEIDADRAYVVKGPGGLLPGSSQLVPPPGRYEVELVSATPDAATPHQTAPSEHEPRANPRVTLEIGENSLSWPLVARETIHYIVMKDRRLTSKE
ncbi:MAG: riboflavin biosynthesis protein RibF [Spirochaetota bacterium]